MQAQPFARPRRGGNLERFAWVFTRISAVVLLGMALYHLVYMHIAMGMDTISFQLIAWRWRFLGWRVFDLVLLGFGWLHGANGMRVVLDDYVHSPLGRFVAHTLLVAVTVLLMALGAFVILAFDAG
jgi:succinate dehydrogenase / fumarate reductase membrane anchor subunit